MLYVSHDRELLAATATKVVTVEADGAWTHGGGFGGYAEARRRHLDTLAKDRALYENERKRLEDLVAEMRRRAKISETFAPKLKAAESRLRQFLERTEQPSQVREQRIDMRLGGARTGKRAVIVEQLVARRADRPVRPRGVVRRAGRRARRQRRRQEPLPASARR